MALLGCKNKISILQIWCSILEIENLLLSFASKLRCIYGMPSTKISFEKFHMINYDAKKIVK
jgi:hypothetical protein